MCIYMCVCVSDHCGLRPMLKNLFVRILQIFVTSFSSPVQCLLLWPGAYPRVENLKGASHGQASALPANIILGWKGLPETNTLAYYEIHKLRTIYL